MTTLAIFNAFIRQFCYTAIVMRFLRALFSALVLLAPFGATAEINSLDQQLRGHTFSYTDKKTKIEHTIYFSRFGNSYDEYFPCEFVDGTWRITKAGRLCLEDRANKSRRDGKTCWKPVIKDQQISFFDTAGKLAYQAKLIKGNSMPLG